MVLVSLHRHVMYLLLPLLYSMLKYKYYWVEHGFSQHTQTRQVFPLLYSMPKYKYYWVEHGFSQLTQTRHVPAVASTIFYA